MARHFGRCPALAECTLIWKFASVCVRVSVFFSYSIQLECEASLSLYFSPADCLLRFCLGLSQIMFEYAQIFRTKLEAHQF